MRRFFRAPKTYVKTDGLENIYNFTLNIFFYINLLSKLRNKAKVIFKYALLSGGPFKILNAPSLNIDNMGILGKTRLQTKLLFYYGPYFFLISL